MSIKSPILRLLALSLSFFFQSTNNRASSNLNKCSTYPYRKLNHIITVSQSLYYQIVLDYVKCPDYKWLVCKSWTALLHTLFFLSIEIEMSEYLSDICQNLHSREDSFGSPAFFTQCHGPAHAVSLNSQVHHYIQYRTIL